MVAVVGALLFPCNAVLAGQMYNIDPTQSYVTAYTPTWVISSYSLSLTQDGQFTSMPTWGTQWNLTSFALSGSFDGYTEWSTWAPGVGHFTIAQTNFNVGIPSAVSFNPPSLLTFYQSTGAVADLSGPCALDPFYGAPPLGWSCTGFSIGFPANVSGVIEDSAFDIQGGSGGIPELLISTYSGMSPPTSFDLGLYPQQYSYRIVANAVPEPATLWLLFLGIVALLYQTKKAQMGRVSGSNTGWLPVVSKLFPPNFSRP